MKRFKEECSGEKARFSILGKFHPSSFIRVHLDAPAVFRKSTGRDATPLASEAAASGVAALPKTKTTLPHVAVVSRRIPFVLHPFPLLLLILSFILHPSCFSFAAPQPSFSYYGQITTELGLPFIPGDQATLLVYSGSRVIARTAVQRTGVAGCNYVAEIPLDSDTTAYRDYALKSGADVTFVLADANNHEVTLYPVGPIPAVGRPGDARRLNLSTGFDSLGDGLTDAFRQYILDASQGGFTNLSQVLPGDDFDGDGMSNADEFRAGTDPTWAADVLYVDQVSPAEEGRIAFEFYAVEGIAYAFHGTAETNTDGHFDWTRVPWSTAPDGNLESAAFTGRGRLATVYLPADQKVKIFKLTVE